MSETEGPEPIPEGPTGGRSDPHGWAGGLWPSADYARQVEQLRAAVGETVFVAELALAEVQLGVRITDRPFVLLGVLDFPRPDPIKGLAPHLVLLDDGRGLNLGRIARIARNRPFAPAPDEILFQDRDAVQTLLFQERQLSPGLIARRSKALLGEILGEGRGAGPVATIAPPEAPASGPTPLLGPPNEV